MENTLKSWLTIWLLNKQASFLHFLIKIISHSLQRQRRKISINLIISLGKINIWDAILLVVKKNCWEFNTTTTKIPETFKGNKSQKVHINEKNVKWSILNTDNNIFNLSKSNNFYSWSIHFHETIEMLMGCVSSLVWDSHTGQKIGKEHVWIRKVKIFSHVIHFPTANISW